MPLTAGRIVRAARTCGKRRRAVEPQNGSPLVRRTRLPTTCEPTDRFRSWTLGRSRPTTDVTAVVAGVRSVHSGRRVDGRGARRRHQPSSWPGRRRATATLGIRAAGWRPRNCRGRFRPAAADRSTRVWPSTAARMPQAAASTRPTPTMPTRQGGTDRGQISTGAGTGEQRREVDRRDDRHGQCRGGEPSQWHSPGSRVVGDVARLVRRERPWPLLGSAEGSRVGKRVASRNHPRIAHPHPGWVSAAAVDGGERPCRPIPFRLISGKSAPAGR